MTTVDIQVVSTIHSDPQHEPEVIKQQLRGTWEQNGDEWKLRYKENKETAEEISTLVRSRPDELIIIRRGDISYKQIYRLGKTTESQLQTPAGRMETQVSTHQYQRMIQENHGKIEFAFDLTMNRQQLGTYKLEITWVEALR